jgi:hypothetical protein
MANFAAIADSFVKFYYATFDANRAGVAGVYVRSVLNVCVVSLILPVF